ncbi:MAG: hypothetical protein ACRDGJ_07775, partial [Candidatus Limnocylindria bacterium]
MPRSLSYVCALAVVLTLPLGAAPPAAAVEEPAQAADFAPDRVVVRWRAEGVATAWVQAHGLGPAADLPGPG